MISIECSKCPRKLRVSDDAAGKTAECPCVSTFSVPSAERTASQPSVTQAIPAQAIPWAKPVELSEDHSFPALPVYHAPPVSYRGEISASVASAPIRTSGAFGERPTNQSVASSYLENARQESSNSTYAKTGGWSNFFDAPVIGGLVVMFVAVGWFVARLAADVKFFYAPVMFVLGMITVVKGIMSND